MLPDDYENLSESVFASVFFSNNILSGITTKNYWDIGNNFKPLMHLWYIGVLVEFYFVFPVILIIENKIRTKLEKSNGGYALLIVATIASFIMFLLPIVSDSDKFYFLPCRFFEPAVGGLIGIAAKRSKELNISSVLNNIFVFMIVAILLIGLIGFDFDSIGTETRVIGENASTESQLLLPNSVLVLMIVFLGSCTLLSNTGILDKCTLLAFIGKRSYSLFIWHQVLLAFYRYSISTKCNIYFVLGYLLIVFIISEISYRYLETFKFEKRSVVLTTLCAVILCIASMTVYVKAGVVRDVPELNIKQSEVHRGMHAEYCDRIYSYNKEFSDHNSDAIKVLVVGNSYARDWANILLESQYSDSIDLSYSFEFDDDLVSRVNKADCLFVFMDKSDVPDYIWKMDTLKNNVWGIGTKVFGSSNGCIYAKRFTDDYFNTAVLLDEGYRNLNERWKSEWGDRYIDLISPLLTDDGKIKVFTDDNKFISQDCRHLTEAGASYYAKILDIGQYLL